MNLYQYDPADYLKDDLGMDSLDIVSLAMDLEEEHNIEISDCALSKWRTVADVLATVGGGGA